jgi:Flp pilus assembly protein TadG
MINSLRYSIVRSPRFPSRRLRDDEGSAVAEFALITPLLLLAAVAVLQLALALHVRTSLTSAAAEGARGAALAGSDLRIGEARTRDFLATSLAGGAVRSVSGNLRTVQGTPMVEMRVTADLPLIGLFGPVPMTVTGRAVLELT